MAALLSVESLLMVLSVAHFEVLLEDVFVTVAVSVGFCLARPA